MKCLFALILVLVGVDARADAYIQPATVCANQSIPTSNTIGGTAAETAFATTCIIKAGQQAPGSVAHLHVGGIYTAAATQAATGKVRITNSGAPNLTSDTTVINTGTLNGIAGATQQEWWGDVFITWLAGATAIDVQGMLIFQAATIAIVPVGNTGTFTIDPTKDLTIYLTVQWSSNSTGNSMQLRSMVAK